MFKKKTVKINYLMLALIILLSGIPSFVHSAGASLKVQMYNNSSRHPQTQFN
jgi:hypothetical protein